MSDHEWKRLDGTLVTGVDKNGDRYTRPATKHEQQYGLPMGYKTLAHKAADRIEELETQLATETARADELQRQLERVAVVAANLDVKHCICTEDYYRLGKEAGLEEAAKRIRKALEQKLCGRKRSD